MAQPESCCNFPPPRRTLQAPLYTQLLRDQACRFCRELGSPTSAASSVAFAAAAAGRAADTGAAPAFDVISVRIQHLAERVEILSHMSCRFSQSHSHTGGAASAVGKELPCSCQSPDTSYASAKLCCCALHQVRVVAAKQQGEGRQQFTAYLLAVEAEGGASWEVTRRFSDFQVCPTYKICTSDLIMHALKAGLRPSAGGCLSRWLQLAREMLPPVIKFVFPVAAGFEASPSNGGGAGGAAGVMGPPFQNALHHRGQQVCLMRTARSSQEALCCALPLIRSSHGGGRTLT